MEFNIADMFEATADAVPDRVALVCQDARFTYGELDERANRLAHHLADKAGVGAGDHVGIYAPNCVEWVDTLLAAYKLRAVPINVNYRYVADELRYLFDDADLTALVYQPEYRDKVDEVAPQVSTMRHTLAVGDEYDAALAAASPRREFEPRSGDDRYVIYTGGTTGMPKGVVWRQEDAFFVLLGGGNFGGPPPDSPTALAERAAGAGRFVALITPPLMHGGGQWVLLSGLLGGITLVLLEGRYDGRRVWELVEREGVNTMSIIGDAMARPIADAYAEAVAAGRPYDAASLFVIGSGGAPLSPAVRDELHALLPNVAIINSFGASETGYQGRVDPAAADGGGPRFAMGESTAVLDDNLRVIEPGSGVIGRVARRGRVPVEYHKDPEKTAATFVEVDGERWALLGDMGTPEADGTITLLGRGSMCINSGGEKIFPEEVEATLKAHADVFDALVVGVPDDRFGERVAAVLSLRDGRSVTTEELVAHCRASLAGYKVPREVFVVDAVERQPSGKPDYAWAKRVATGATTA